MPKVTRVVPHLSRQEVLEQIKATTGFWRVQKWLVIWNALVDPRPAKQIALHTGLAKQTVHNLISGYNRQGPRAVAGPGKGGRQRAYLSLDEEAAFLEPFREKALTGQIATAAEFIRPWKNDSAARFTKPVFTGCSNATDGEKSCRDRFTLRQRSTSKRILKKIPSKSSSNTDAKRSEG